MCLLPSKNSHFGKIYHKTPAYISADNRMLFHLHKIQVLHLPKKTDSVEFSFLNSACLHGHCHHNHFQLEMTLERNSFSTCFCLLGCRLLPLVSAIPRNTQFVEIITHLYVLKLPKLVTNLLSLGEHVLYFSFSPQSFFSHTQSHPQ